MGSYYDDFRTESLIGLTWLKNDVGFLIQRMKGEKFDPSGAKILRGYINHALSGVREYASNTLTRVKALTFVGGYVRDRYELMFSDYLLRFGPLTNVSLLYRAIDSICTEIAGRTHVQKSPKIAVIFGGHPVYSVEPGTCLVRLRPTDTHRLWNWGILGHEIGHIPGYRRTRTESRPRMKSYSLKQITQLVFPTPHPQSVMASWTDEIIADLFGILTLGPCVMRAHMMIPRLWCLMEIERGVPLEWELLEFFSTHPPDEVRCQIMCNAIEDMRIETNLREYAKIENIVNFRGLTRTKKRILRKRLRGTERLSDSLWDTLQADYRAMKEEIEIFSPENWERSLQFEEYLQRKEKNLPKNLKPSEILNGFSEVRPMPKTLRAEKNLVDRALKCLLESTLI